MATSREGAPKGRADVVFRQLDDEWVLFDPRSEQLHVLNLSAALVWTHCDGQIGADAIAEAVATAFEPRVPTAQARRDVDDALERFRHAGLLE